MGGQTTVFCLRMKSQKTGDQEVSLGTTCSAMNNISYEYISYEYIHIYLVLVGTKAHCKKLGPY